MEAKFISLKEASVRFGPSTTSLRNLIRSGRLSAVRYAPNGKIWLRVEEVQRLATPVDPAPAQTQHDQRANIEAATQRVFGDDWQTKLKQARLAGRQAAKAERQHETMH